MYKLGANLVNIGSVGWSPELAMDTQTFPKSPVFGFMGLQN